jgi:hypothetical protein
LQTKDIFNFLADDDRPSVFEIELPISLKDRLQQIQEQGLQIEIPLDPQEFYEDFGFLVHPRTGEVVVKLAPWQYEIWFAGFVFKRRLVIKSQKVGESTAALIEDFQRALTTCKGKDILIIAQTQYHANEHLRTLKNLVINSDKYRNFLITNPSELLFREEKTKVGVAYIKNPDNLYRPSRIIALGASEGAIWSWKNVAHIHMSDIAAADILDDSGLFAAAFSRLANTDGTMLIETPPRGTKGKTYEIYQESSKDEETLKEEGNFKLFTVKASQAVMEGMITQEFLDAERKRLGHLYPQFYEAEFIAGTGNLFDYDSIIACENRGRIYGLEQIIPSQIDYSTVKSIGFDVGLGSSHYNVTALEWLPGNYSTVIQGLPGILRVIFSKEYDRAVYGDMIKEIVDLNNLIRPRKLYGGAVNPEVIRDVKIAIGERKDYEILVARAKNQKRPVEKYMQVVPLPEGSMGNEANYHARAWVESGLLAINPVYSNLLQQMKMAIVKPNGQLDKNAMPTTDSLDGFKFACMYFKFDAASGARNAAFRLQETGDGNQ